MDASFEDQLNLFGLIVVLKHLKLVVYSIQIFTLQSILKHDVDLLLKVHHLLDEFIQVEVLVRQLFLSKNAIFIWSSACFVDIIKLPQLALQSFEEIWVFEYSQEQLHLVSLVVLDDLLSFI